MKHVAIDLGGRESQVCSRGPDGSILQQGKVATRSLPTLVKTWEPSKIVMETSAEAFRIADAAIASGHQVRVVPATLVKQLGVGSRSVKNDRKDAQVLSEVSCRIELPSVHIPSENSRLLKSVCGSREALVKTRTLLTNNVKGWFRTQLVRIRTGAPETISARARESATASSIELPPHIERELLVLEAMNIQIKEADKQLRQVASNSPVCRRLMTVPGVGPVTAVRFLAAIDDHSRFRNAHAVQSYLGLTPGENSSSERKQHTGITKAGPSDLRRTLIQAAWANRRFATGPLAAWTMQLEARRGKFIAVVALARKLAGILFAMWRDGTSYQSSKSAREVSPS